MARQIIDATVLRNPYLQKFTLDNPRQLVFLANMAPEILFGGAAGGGKSSALLAAGLQFCQTPGYNALIIRSKLQDLTQPGCLIPVSHEWLGDTDARWRGDTNEWFFPSGAVMKFGYLDSEDDKYNFRSAEYAYIGIDEASTVLPAGYTYLFSRLRTRINTGIPVRFRAGSNPGGRAHEFLRDRFFVEGPTHKGPNGEPQPRIYIPSFLRDNAHLDYNEYLGSLHELDPVTKAQLLNGDWSARSAGLFKREWFGMVPVRPPNVRNWVRFWDLAATTPKSGTDPDYTAGVLIGMADGVIYIADVKRDRISPRNIESMIRNTAAQDGRSVRIRMEEEKGSAGKNLIDHYARHILPGFDFAGVKPTGDPYTLAGPLASAAQLGNVQLVRAAWNMPFLEELDIFPNEGAHDDQVKAACLGLQEVVAKPGAFRMWIPKPPARQLPAM